MNDYIVKAEKIVTVSNSGTITDGAMVIKEGTISDIGSSERISKQYPNLPTEDYKDLVISPSLVDCHTHLLEFAPPSLFPVTNKSHLLAGRTILLNALFSGITALGEQVCGNPMFDANIDEFKKASKDIPIDITFAATSISIGLPNLVHFTSTTGRQPVARDVLVNKEVIELLAKESEYPGENIFINATPANFVKEEVPNAGEIIYSQEELDEIVSIFHSYKRKIGTHVAGTRAIEMALNAQFDVFHHAHGITEQQIKQAAKQKVMIVATPLGGTHLPPNTVEEVMKMLQYDVEVAIATDAYLPPHDQTVNFPMDLNGLNGPESLLTIAHPFFIKMKQAGYNENEILTLLTLNPAKVLGKEHRFGNLTVGKDANFLVSNGVPGLDFYQPVHIKAVFFRGNKVMTRE